MRWKPSVTVAAIVQRGDRFLLIEEQQDGVQVFNQPAGHLEKNETLVDAVKREVLEETAWKFEPEYVVGIYLYPATRGEITYLRVCFAGSCLDHDPDRKLDDEIIQVCWMTKTEIESKKQQIRSPMVLQCVEDFVAGQRYPIELLKDYLSSPPEN